MNQQRTVLLSVCIGFFALVCGLLVYSRVQYNRSHFRIGAVPQNFVNQLLPKAVPIESIRPPAIRAQDPMRYGNATSIVSIIEFGDFECEFCRTLNPEIRQAVTGYGGRVRFIWRDLPIEDRHKNALSAAVFARCAGQQGKFWEAYDALMSTATLGERPYQEIAGRLKLEPNLLASCRNNPAVEAAIRRDAEEARADGIQSVPFIFVGTKAIEGFVDAETLEKEIQASLSSL